MVYQAPGFTAEQGNLQEIAVSSTWVQHPGQHIGHAVPTEITLEDLDGFVHIATELFAGPGEDDGRSSGLAQCCTGGIPMLRRLSFVTAGLPWE